MNSTRNFDQFYVIKRSGDKQQFNIDKIFKRVDSLSSDLEVNIQELITSCSLMIYDGITTSELDKLISEEAHSRIRHTLDYNTLASRLRWSDHHKKTSGSFGDKFKLLTPLLDSQYIDFTRKNLTIIETTIDYSKDYNIDYLGFMILEKSYLLRIDGRVIESYQDLLMRVALYINLYDINSAIETYQLLSDNIYTHATSTLFNAGLKDAMMSSCFLLENNDNMGSITETWKRCGITLSKCGGISINFTRIREKNRHIRSSGGKSRGIIPFIKILSEISEAIDQGGKRNGSIAISLEVWHPEISSFLELKTNTGDEELKARTIFTALMIPDIFFERLSRAIQTTETILWSFFSPVDCPQLIKLYSEEFTEEYTKLEEQKKFIFQEDILKVWSKILKSLIESGNPYMLSKCNINRSSNHRYYGTITSSNLCNEIVQYHDSDKTAVCNLCSISLPKFIENGRFNFDKLKSVMKIIVKNMNSLIDLDNVPIPNNSLDQRPMGIGVQGLSDVFAILKLSWDSDEARELNRLIFEHLYYYAIEYSIEPESYNWMECDNEYSIVLHTPLSMGEFHFELTRNKPTQLTLDWESLRKKLFKYKIRNTMFIALMPTASSSQILGNVESFELQSSNIYTRKVQAGDFTIINKHLYRDLKELNLWKKEIVDQIISNDGSVQNISEIPKEIKQRYLTSWEIPQRVLLDHAIDRTPFVDQSQSFNICYSSDRLNVDRLTSYYLAAWKGGMKTLSYYLRTRMANEAVKFSIELKEKEKKREIVCTDDVCTSCSS
jgi:ribonucleoside-diphosphate reductase alpha chain